MGNTTFGRQCSSTTQTNSFDNDSLNENFYNVNNARTTAGCFKTSSINQAQHGNQFNKQYQSKSSKSSSGYGSHSSSKKCRNNSHESGTSLATNTDECDTIEKLHYELCKSKRQVYEREQQLLKLHREVHKLRSVLDQSDTLVNAIKRKDSLNIQFGNSIDYGGAFNFGAEKKKGVSSESFSSNRSFAVQKLNVINKDFDSRRVIQEALIDNAFLKNYLNAEQLDLIVNSMYEKEFAKNCFICKCGTYGCHLYVITYGHCEVIDSRDRPVNQIGPGKAFGELALLYNCTRTASVKTITRVRTWVLDRKAFQMIMMKTSCDRTENIKRFLKTVPLLKNLNDEKITKIIDAVEVNYFPNGEYICRQGSFGDSFYIISKGSVKVTKIKNKFNDEDQVTEEETIRKLGTGDYFGEQALLLLEGAKETLNPVTEKNDSEDVKKFYENIGAVRTANVISEDCECFVLNQVHFFDLLGDLQEIKYKLYTDQTNQCNDNINELNKMNDNRLAKLIQPDLKSSDKFIDNLNLNDLDIVTQLGMGGFGVVNLVRHKNQLDKVFAMKKYSKEFIRALHQQQHIINEKLVLQSVAGKCAFIIQLYRTFHDEQSVYFLMETALGGELWTVLRQRGPFNEQSVRFYAACVVEALQFLHSLNIIYRDLKPENCLLDTNGYLKLTDFGFSKPLKAGEKTWTFCGTPEYVAPEIILNKGHDKAVDIWALGILIYELLTGMPPFISPDPLQTYRIILRGFDSIGFDENISKNCINLIRNLCCENPNERLGIRGRNGYNDIKRHKWFSGFNWNNLLKRKMPAPFVPKLTSNTDTRHFEFFGPGDELLMKSSTNEYRHLVDHNNNKKSQNSILDKVRRNSNKNVNDQLNNNQIMVKNNSNRTIDSQKLSPIAKSSTTNSSQTSNELKNVQEDSSENGNECEFDRKDWENYF